MQQAKITHLFSHESKCYQEFDDRIVISCGESAIILHKDGKIELKATAFIQTAETIELQAKRVDICP